MPKKIRPDFIVALLAVVIGLCTMFVYIYQARIMSNQMHASVWPYVETNFGQGSQGIELSVENKGIGPAHIKQFLLILDGIPFADNQKQIDSLLTAFIGEKASYDYTNALNRVLKPGEILSFLKFSDLRTLKKLDSALVGHRVEMEVCYCSVYDDCWRKRGAKVEPCDTCNEP
jgi:hypothetical protein